jgi:hypothetical protein
MDEWENARMQECENVERSEIPPLQGKNASPAFKRPRDFETSNNNFKI